MLKSGQNKKQLEKKLVQITELANTRWRKQKSQLLLCHLMSPKPTGFGGRSPPSTLQGAAESFGQAGMKGLERG